MALLDDLKRELERALEEAKRTSEAGPSGPVAQPPRRPAAGPTPMPPQGRAVGRLGETVRSTAPTQRVGGRLLKDKLERGPAVPTVTAVPREATEADFRRKVAAMQQGEASALNALPASAFLEPTAAAPLAAEPASLRFTPGDILRSVILSEVLGTPRGRRGR